MSIIPGLFICIYVLVDIDFARVYYRQYYINYLFWYLVVLTIAIKVLFGLIGHKLTGRPEESLFGLKIWNIAPYIFVLDCALHFAIWLGWYFEIGNYITNPYVYNGHYLIIFTINAFVSFILYFFTTLRRNGRNVYGLFFGLTAMSIGNIITTKIIQGVWTSINVANGRYFLIMLTMIFFNAFIVYNSFMVINYRVTKFYEHEFIYCYYCFYTDLVLSVPFDRRKAKALGPSNKRDTGMATIDIEQAENARKSRKTLL
jgi:hypothetical protein